jgi:hypothetical protein
LPSTGRAEKSWSSDSAPEDVAADQAELALEIQRRQRAATQD